MRPIQKIGLMIVVFSFAWYVPCAAEPRELSSRVSAVTVYPDSALITRTATFTANAGEQTVVFTDIIPSLEEDSVRVARDSAVDITILSAQVKKEYLEEVGAEEIRKLQNELQDLEDEKQALLNQRLALDDEKKFLDSFRFFTGTELPKDLVTQVPEKTKLTDTLSFLRDGLADYYLRLRETQVSLRELDKKIEVARKKLQEVSGGVQKVRRSIAVDLNVPRSAEVTLHVSYRVWGASWSSQYDARAFFDKGIIKLVSYGLIRQKTGEDWNDVQLSLSTARPALGGRMPYVSPWFIRPPETRMARKSMGVAGAMAPAMQYEAFSDKEPQEAMKEEKLSVTQEKGIAVVYTLTRAVTVKSDGTEHKLPVFSQEMSAEFLYSSYPRAAAYAYLGSRVKNDKEAQLLTGKVNVFLDGDYVGASSIDTIGPGEEFDLYLGADENVKVKRERVQKKVDQTLIAGIPSSSTRTRFTFKVTVENYKSKEIKVKLFEAMPVSEDERIRVKIEKVNVEPAQKDWEDRKGVWLWELQLKPGEKQELFYTFTVEHPRGLEVEGL